MFGSLHWEGKKGKWQKRHFFIRDGMVYHCKDAKVTFAFIYFIEKKKEKLN
jgi:hypothetical protein